MSRHYRLTFEPWLTEILRSGSFRETCIPLKIRSSLTLIKTGIADLYESVIMKIRIKNVLLFDHLVRTSHSQRVER